MNKRAIIGGPVSVRIRDAEVLAACTQSKSCQRAIATAINASLKTYAATSDTRAAQRAGMQSLQLGQRHARDSQQSRTASALAKVVTTPSLLRVYAWSKLHGTRQHVRLKVFAPADDSKANPRRERHVVGTPAKGQRKQHQAELLHLRKENAAL